MKIFFELSFSMPFCQGVVSFELVELHCVLCCIMQEISKGASFLGYILSPRPYCPFHLLLSPVSDFASQVLYFRTQSISLVAISSR